MYIHDLLPGAIPITWRQSASSMPGDGKSVQVHGHTGTMPPFPMPIALQAQCHSRHRLCSSSLSSRRSTPQEGRPWRGRVRFTHGSSEYCCPPGTIASRCIRVLLARNPGCVWSCIVCHNRSHSRSRPRHFKRFESTGMSLSTVATASKSLVCKDLVQHSVVSRCMKSSARHLPGSGVLQLNQ